MANSEMKIFSGTAHPELSENIAKYIGKGLSKINISRFSGGEIYTRILENVRGASTYVIQTCSENVNQDLMELFLIIDALKRASAKSITAVIPHFGYARQDKKSASREPISAKLIANLLTTAGIDRIITMDVHADQIQGFFDVPMDHLTAMPLFEEYLKNKKIKDPIVVAPDTGRAKTAKKLSDRLGTNLAILHKTRPEHQKAEIMHIVGDVKGKSPVIVDDMVDTAGTATHGVDILRKNGCIDEIYFVSTHGILSGKAVERMNNAKFKEVVVTDSLPTANKKIKGLQVVSVAPLFGEAIKRNYENLSISSLFD
ncbi:ribose-phosphate diphosphokinase [Candidatus Margulisiibacteriota bacterium]